MPGQGLNLRLYGSGPQQLAIRPPGIEKWEERELNPRLLVFRQALQPSQLSHLKRQLESESRLNYAPAMGRAGFAPATRSRLFYRELLYPNRRADPGTEREGFEPSMV